MSLPSQPGTPTTLQAGAYREAMARAGRLLADRTHFEAELRAKLLRAGFVPAVVDQVMGRLRDLGLVDDAAAARQFAAERAGRRPRAGIVEDLVARGITRDLAEELAPSAAAEEAAAVALAGRRVRALAGKPVATQAAAVYSALVRRGFDPEVAEAATRAVLPPEGWD